MRVVIFLSLVLGAAAAPKKHTIVHPNEDLIDQASKHHVLRTSKLIPVHPNENVIDEELTKGSRIVGGVNADISEFPHQVSLLRRGSHTCGAIILNMTFLICAAHCTQNAVSDYSVRAGITERTDENGQNRAVVSITNHPDYNDGSGTYANDISLIELDRPLTFDENVYQGDLPPEGETFAGWDCWLSGWGRLSGGGSLPENLQKVEMTVMSYVACTNYFGSGVLQSHVCVNSGDPKSACQGDSGGPITCTSGNKNYIVGAASWVISGCTGAHPSAYTRITSFLDFIRYYSN